MTTLAELKTFLDESLTAITEALKTHQVDNAQLTADLETANKRIADLDAEIEQLNADARDHVASLFDSVGLKMPSTDTPATPDPVPVDVAPPVEATPPVAMADPVNGVSPYAPQIPFNDSFGATV